MSVTNVLPLEIDYDRAADVLYLTKERVAAARGVEDVVSGFVWRYSRDGALIGLTILDFRDRWLNHKDDLEREISGRFHISESEAASIIEAAQDQ